MSGMPPTNDNAGSRGRRGRFLLLAVLVGWGAWSGWSLWQARQAAVALNETIERDWPADSAPKIGTRTRLAAATDRLAQGDWSAVVADLGAIEPPSRSQDITARRFLADHQTLRSRFTTAAAVAQSLEDSGVNVDGVRDTLARAVCAAGRRDEPTTITYVAMAEDLLRQTELGGDPSLGTNATCDVVAMTGSIGPAFLLSQDLLTEGSVAPRKLLSRAAWYTQAGECRRAIVLIRLAGELLDSRMSRDQTGDKRTPEWFDALAEEPILTATQAQAEAAVALAEVMIESELTVEPIEPEDEPAQPTGPVVTLVDKARLELAAGRPGEAYWWASVAMNALGMTDESINLATADAL